MIQSEAIDVESSDENQNDKSLMPEDIRSVQESDEELLETRSMRQKYRI